MIIEYSINKSSINDIIKHLTNCSSLFIPKLDSYVDISEYSNKIYSKCIRFEAYNDKSLIGLIASYLNEKNKSLFITNFSVDINYQKKGISKNLLEICKNYSLLKKCESVFLEVFEVNTTAINFYNKNDFKILNRLQNKVVMELKIRDYNREILDTDEHKYVYNFDFDVMHKYMIESFKPFLKEGNALELGSYKGDFTEKIIPFFKNITCIEGSEDAIIIANRKFSNLDNIKLILSTFEELNLFEKFDNVILTHVLEHVDNPVELLKKINDTWLNDNGVLFVVCPNANSPSRQIAVKMGIISHTTAITESEMKHGHKITYNMDTLERDISKSGLKIIYRTGIFFKALANFQWDKLLNTDIISNEYLDGCFKLGQQYPDLCSSIMFVCKKGKL